MSFIRVPPKQCIALFIGKKDVIHSVVPPVSLISQTVDTEALGGLHLVAVFSVARFNYDSFCLSFQGSSD